MEYLKEYYYIINNRRNNILKKSKLLYTELHHIKPRSLFKKNTPDNIVNHPDNLVRLTGEEHFLCHYYLYHTFEYGSKERYSTLEGFNAMGLRNTNHYNRFFNSTLYKEGREDLLKEYELKGLNDIEMICDFIDENGYKPNQKSKYDIERKLGNKLSLFRQIQSGNKKDGIIFDSYQILLNNRNYSDLLFIKSDEDLGIIRLNKICDFIDENGKIPIKTSKNIIERKLSHNLINFRRNKKKLINWYKSYDDILIKRNLINIILTKEEKEYNTTKNLIDWIIKSNKFPNKNSKNNIERTLGIKYYSLLSKSKNNLNKDIINLINEFIILMKEKDYENKIIIKFQKLI